MGFILYLLMIFSSSLLSLSGCYESKQAAQLQELIRQRSFENPQQPDSQVEFEVKNDFKVYMAIQKGMMEANRILELPGQPKGTGLNQYGGYVTVDEEHGRALFYYFVESIEDPYSKPLVLWLNGGPGCSSLGYGAMEELGPFRVKNDGRTLISNEYSWNKVASIIFLESPVGVGFSYSNTTRDYALSGDQRTAEDSYTFLVNWFERFPQYKNHEFFIAGESYAGHYVPDLAKLILLQNKKSIKTLINLKGILMGNAYVDSRTNQRGEYEFFWRRSLISDETHREVNLKCNFESSSISSDCRQALHRCSEEMGYIDHYNIYAPVCKYDNKQAQDTAFSTASLYDPCTDKYIEFYLNLPEVQKALHANVSALPGRWGLCQDLPWDYKGSDHSMLPKIKQVIAEGVRTWLYSGDVDSIVSVLATQYSIKKLGLPVQETWRPWYTDEEVGGYVVGYQGLVFMTVRGAGHQVPSYQPSRALTLVSFFLQGRLPE